MRIVSITNRLSYTKAKKEKDIGKHTGVGVLLGSDVVHLDHVAALEAALDGALAGDLKGVESVSRTGDISLDGAVIRSAS